MECTQCRLRFAVNAARTTFVALRPRALNSLSEMVKGERGESKQPQQQHVRASGSEAEEGLGNEGSATYHTPPARALSALGAAGHISWRSLH